MSRRHTLPVSINITDENFFKPLKVLNKRKSEGDVHHSLNKVPKTEYVITYPHVNDIHYTCVSNLITPKVYEESAFSTVHQSVRETVKVTKISSVSDSEKVKNSTQIIDLTGDDSPDYSLESDGIRIEIQSDIKGENIQASNFSEQADVPATKASMPLLSPESPAEPTQAEAILPQATTQDKMESSNRPRPPVPQFSRGKPSIFQEEIPKVRLREVRTTIRVHARGIPYQKPQEENRIHRQEPSSLEAQLQNQSVGLRVVHQEAAKEPQRPPVEAARLQFQQKTNQPQLNADQLPIEARLQFQQKTNQPQQKADQLPIEARLQLQQKANQLQPKADHQRPTESRIQFQQKANQPQQKDDHQLPIEARLQLQHKANQLQQQKAVEMTQFHFQKALELAHQRQLNLQQHRRQTVEIPPSQDVVEQHVARIQSTIVNAVAAFEAQKKQAGETIKSPNVCIANKSNVRSQFPSSYPNVTITQNQQQSTQQPSQETMFQMRPQALNHLPPNFNPPQLRLVSANHTSVSYHLISNSTCGEKIFPHIYKFTLWKQGACRFFEENRRLCSNANEWREDQQAFVTYFEHACHQFGQRLIKDLSVVDVQNFAFDNVAAVISEKMAEQRITVGIYKICNSISHLLKNCDILCNTPFTKKFLVTVKKSMEHLEKKLPDPSFTPIQLQLLKLQIEQFHHINNWLKIQMRNAEVNRRPSPPSYSDIQNARVLNEHSVISNQTNLDRLGRSDNVPATVDIPNQRNNTVENRALLPNPVPSVVPIVAQVCNSNLAKEKNRETVQSVVSSTTAEETPSVKNDTKDSEDVIDLTWLDDADEKKVIEEIIECKVFPFKTEDNHKGEDSGTEAREVVSPVDSGLGSPVAQSDDGFKCLCGNRAIYICACNSSMYCSSDCQVKDWVYHQKLCHKMQS